MDQGQTSEHPAAAAKAHGIALEVVKLPEAKKGTSCFLGGGWVACARLRAPPKNARRLHFVALAILLLRRPADLAVVHNSL